MGLHEHVRGRRVSGGMQMDVCREALTSSKQVNDRAVRVGTRPRCNWEPLERWWVTAEADPVPDIIENMCANNC